MLSLPGLAGPPILAFIALAVFLTFWIIVVICLATANYPGMKPLIPFAQLQPAETNMTEPKGVGKNNTGLDYKSELEFGYQVKLPNFFHSLSITTRRISRG